MAPKLKQDVLLYQKFMVLLAVHASSKNIKSLTTHQYLNLRTSAEVVNDVINGSKIQNANIFKISLQNLKPVISSFPTSVEEVQKSICQTFTIILSLEH